MNKNTGIVVGVIALVVVAGGVYAAMKSNEKMIMVGEQVMRDTLKMEETIKEIEEMEKEKAMKDKEADEAMIKNDETGMADKADTMMKVGVYEAYSAEKIARAETGDVVLFFHASWCPSCRGLNASIESNLSSLPKGVTILKADYDKEVELKKKYEVTTQHTLVQVDKDGNMIKKWSGSPSLESLVSQIQ